jgi:hypothetical protein
VKRKKCGSERKTCSYYKNRSSGEGETSKGSRAAIGRILNQNNKFKFLFSVFSSMAHHCQSKSFKL